ncbi:MAG: hypothetical protein V1821_03595 [bacterium]
MPEKHFLEQFKTHLKPEAMSAAYRAEKLRGAVDAEGDPAKRVQAYMGRLEEIFNHPNEERRKKLIEAFKKKLFSHPKVLIRAENFPEDYFEYQARQAKRRGLGKIEFPKEDRQAEIQKVIESQKRSLNAWLDLLTGNEGRKYSTDVKYFVMQGVLKLGDFDTEKYFFANRRPETTTNFPEIDHEALFKILDAMELKYHPKDASTVLEDKDLLDLINAKSDFGKIYAKVMQKLDKEANKESLLPITEGEWRVFDKGSDPKVMVEALAGKRSNLCLANIGEATRYLEKGRVEIFLSYNRAKQPFMPRIALAISDDLGLYEVRGTYNKNEDIDPPMERIDEKGANELVKRVEPLPNGKEFLKKDAHMKRLTAICDKCIKEDRKTKEKTYLNPTLSKDELIFLYEIDAPIQGFGFEKDPRIKELRDRRKPNEDAPIVLDCAPEQIATNQSEINENTKAYIGPLFPGIFKIQNFENIFTRFPEGKIRFFELEIGGKTKDEYISAIQKAGIKISNWAEQLLNSKAFSVKKTVGGLLSRFRSKRIERSELETLDLVKLSVADLGFPNGATVQQIYDQAEKLGLGVREDACPAETGPAYRLQYSEQPLNEWVLVGMRPIAVSDGLPEVFLVRHSVRGQWLDTCNAYPDFRYSAADQWVFRRRK